MNDRDHIRYLHRGEIDTGSWDACIRSAANGLIYGFHSWLDHMAGKQWDALVLGDYEAVMPLPWRRKAGMAYLYQPAFTQQGGVFGPSDIGPEMMDAFLYHLRIRFKFAELNLNYGNPYPGLPARTNFILSLDQPYDRLAANYKKDLVRNLKLAAAASLHYLDDFHLKTALDLYRRIYAPRTPHVRPEDYRHFEQLCLFMQGQGQLLVRAVTGPKQQLLATVVLLRDHNRLYLLQSATLPEGRQLEANHFLLDRLIRECTGQGLILDFEGSDIPGIAHFYANFGSRDQPYYFYRHDRLPWLFRLIKTYK